MRTKFTRIVFAVLLCGFLPTVSSGELITIGLTGKITRADSTQSLFGGQIKIGDPVTAVYSYNSSTLDSNPSDPCVGDYWHYTAPYGISVQIGSFVFETNENNVRFLVEVVNNGPGPSDGYLVLSENNICSNGTLVEGITWQIDDSTQTVLSNDALPATLPNLADWGMDLGLAIFGPGCDNYRIRADITSVVLIPEPATLLLLVFGIVICKRR